MDLGASACIVITLTITIVLEMVADGPIKYFTSTPHCIDFFLLVPSAIGSTVVGVVDVIGGELSKALAIVHIAVFLPCLFFFLVLRLYRVVGDRVLLAEKTACDSFSETEQMDMIWTTPDTKSDLWLQDELLGITGGFVGLHRFVTREQQGEGGECQELSRRFNTSFGERPNFDTIFRKIAHTSPSG